MQCVALALDRLLSLRSLSLTETVSQFSRTMTAQVDLRVEAAHLRRFHRNFNQVASQVWSKGGGRVKRGLGEQKFRVYGQDCQSLGMASEARIRIHDEHTRH